MGGARHLGGRSEVAFEPGEGVYVLTGPARCGKTSAVLRLYRRSLDELGRPGCLVIVPNAPAAAQMRDRLLDGVDTGVLVAPAVTTFAALAAGILSASGRAVETLDPVQRHLLLAGIVAEMASAGELRALGGLADTPGLVAALDGSIAELKRAAVEPEVLAAAVDPDSAKDADLVAIYARYQQTLRETGRYDVEGLMWLARDLLAADPAAALGTGIAAVAVDGFTDFTPTQLEMLTWLARRVRTVLITLPVMDDARSRLWHWTRRTLERVRRALGSAEVVALEAGADPMPSMFDLAARGGEAPVAGSADACPIGITILEAPDVEAEVRAVAGAVKADLLASARPGSVAVLVRNLEGYQEPIERIFAACGIPVAGRPRPLAESNVVRYILALLSLPPEWEFHRLLSIIKSSYFRPGSLGAGFDATTVATAEMAIRTASVLGGREEYAAAFDRLARQARLAAGGEEEEPEALSLGPLMADVAAIESAGAMVEALLGRLDRLADARTLAEYAGAVRELVGALGIASAAAECDDERIVAADLRALRAFDELLEEVAAAAVPVGTDLEKMAGLVARAAEVAVVPPARGESLVAVLDVLDARALRFEKVYLLGLNEKAFPQLRQERCFIDESDRAAWARRSVVLDRRSDLVAREMLLFYLAATRAESHLTVSYVAADAGGSGAASPFLEELEVAARRHGQAVERRRVEPGEFVPPADELASPAEVFNAALLAAFDDSPRTQAAFGTAAPALVGWTAEHCPELLCRACQGLFAAHRRNAAEPPDAFDGRLDDPGLLEGLASTFPRNWVFSASHLNSYARCPWLFFARYLLRLEPLIQPEVQMTPTDRGRFCHAVLYRVLSSLRQRLGSLPPLAELSEEDLTAGLAEAVAAEKQRLAAAAVHSQLWEMQVQYWHDLLRAYLLDQRDTDGAVRPRYFELGFGLSERLGERTDPASVREPVTIDAGGQEIRLRGKIDRVDELAGQDGPALMAVDYKTGYILQPGKMLEGLDVQLALYIKALEVMFGKPVVGGAYHDLRENCHRLFTVADPLKTRGDAPKEYSQQLALMMDCVGRYVRGMREGRFDALPSAGCPSWCPYRSICHYSDHRARRKGTLAGSAGEGSDG